MDDCKKIFKLSNLIKIYASRLSALGEQVSSSQIHSTRFKEKLLEFCPQLKSINNGRDVYSVNDEDISDIIKEASCSSLDNIAYYQCSRR